MYDVWVLEGNCYFNQGQTYARSKQVVLWIENGAPSGDPPHKVIAYFEGEVSVDFAPSQDAAGKPQARIVDRQWINRFQSRTAPDPAREKRGQ